MAGIKTIDLLNILRDYPLFTIKNISRVTGKKPDYVKVMINRMLNNGLIYCVERGKYTVHEDPMIFASHIIYPSYICLWSALRFHDMTAQLPNKTFIAASRSKNNIIFYGRKIMFLKTKHLWGYGKYSYDKFEVFVSDKEKTIIDCLLTGDVPLHEAYTAIDYADSGKLIEYGEKTANKSLIKRLGYLLELKGITAPELEKFAGAPNTPLNPMLGTAGKINKKWKLIINQNIGENDWQQ